MADLTLKEGRQDFYQQGHVADHFQYNVHVLGKRMVDGYALPYTGDPDERILDVHGV